jgi:hypothetical protein
VHLSRVLAPECVAVALLGPLAQRHQLLARPKPVTRERHYVAFGPSLSDAFLSCRTFGFHRVVDLLCGICRAFSPSVTMSVFLAR